MSSIWDLVLCLSTILIVSWNELPLRNLLLDPLSCLIWIIISHEHHFFICPVNCIAKYHSDWIGLILLLMPHLILVIFHLRNWILKILLHLNILLLVFCCVLSLENLVDPLYKVGSLRYWRISCRSLGMINRMWRILNFYCHERWNIAIHLRIMVLRITRLRILIMRSILLLLESIITKQRNRIGDMLLVDCTISHLESC